MFSCQSAISFILGVSFQRGNHCWVGTMDRDDGLRCHSLVQFGFIEPFLGSSYSTGVFSLSVFMSWPKDGWRELSEGHPGGHFVGKYKNYRTHEKKWELWPGSSFWTKDLIFYVWCFTPFWSCLCCCIWWLVGSLQQWDTSLTRDNKENMMYNQWANTSLHY